jgi:hypothetical protein
MNFLENKKRIVYVAADHSLRAVWMLPEGQDAEEIAARRGWSDDEWGVLEIGDFGGYEDYFQGHWNIGNYHSVSFNVESARVYCLSIMRIGRTKTDGFGPYDWAFIIAQSVLPAESRLPEIQALFDAENARAASFQEARVNILQASTPGDLWSLVSPWVPEPLPLNEDEFR